MVNLKEVILFKYIFCNVLCKNCNYSTHNILFQINCNHLSLTIVFGIAITVVFNILKNVLDLLINSVENFDKQEHVQLYMMTIQLVIMYNTYHYHIFYNKLFHTFKKEKIIFVYFLLQLSNKNQTIIVYTKY